MKKFVFIAVHSARSDNGGTGKGLKYELLAFSLRTVESRRRLGRGIQVRDVNKTRNPRLRGDMGNTSRPRSVRVTEREVPATKGNSSETDRGRKTDRKCVLCFVLAANKIVDYVRMTNTLFNLGLVADIPFLLKCTISFIELPISCNVCLP